MSTRDQIAVAQLDGQARYCVNHRLPEAEALASLREIAARPDLLAQAAGMMAGAIDPDSPERPGRIAAARLLVAAGADRAALPGWIERGRWNVRRPIGWGTARELGDDLGRVLADLLEGLPESST
jgi:hypothetical protein